MVTFPIYGKIKFMLKKTPTSKIDGGYNIYQNFTFGEVLVSYVHPYHAIPGKILVASEHPRGRQWLLVLLQKHQLILILISWCFC
jgi:hypothetical protein